MSLYDDYNAGVKKSNSLYDDFNATAKPVAPKPSYAPLGAARYTPTSNALFARPAPLPPLDKFPQQALPTVNQQYSSPQMVQPVKPPVLRPEYGEPTQYGPRPLMGNMLQNFARNIYPDKLSPFNVPQPVKPAPILGQRLQDFTPALSRVRDVTLNPPVQPRPAGELPGVSLGQDQVAKGSTLTQFMQQSYPEPVFNAYNRFVGKPLQKVYDFAAPSKSDLMKSALDERPGATIDQLNEMATQEQATMGLPLGDSVIDPFGGVGSIGSRGATAFSKWLSKGEARIVTRGGKNVIEIKAGQAWKAVPDEATAIRELELGASKTVPKVTPKKTPIRNIADDDLGEIIDFIDDVRAKKVPTVNNSIAVRQLAERYSINPNQPDATLVNKLQDAIEEVPSVRAKVVNRTEQVKRPETPSKAEITKEIEETTQRKLEERLAAERSLPGTKKADFVEPVRKPEAVRVEKSPVVTPSKGILTRVATEKQAEKVAAERQAIARTEEARTVKNVDRLKREALAETQPTPKPKPVSVSSSNLTTEAKKYKSADEYWESLPKHGAKSEFSTFDKNMIGKGEGSYTYGKGLYLGGEADAKHYSNIVRGKILGAKFNQGTNLVKLDELVTSKQGANKLLKEIGVPDTKIKMYGGKETDPAKYFNNVAANIMASGDDIGIRLSNKLQEAGYDGMIYPKMSGGGDFTVIWNTDKVEMVTKSQLTDIWNKANKPKGILATAKENLKSPTGRQGGHIGLNKPKEFPKKPVLAKPSHVKIDADVKDIRKAVKKKEANAETIGKLSTEIDIKKGSIPEVGILRKIAGRNTDDTLQQIQATAMKKIETNVIAKDMSITDAVRILKEPKAHNAKTLEAARLVRRANLDDVATEEGYKSLDEAQIAIEQARKTKEEIIGMTAEMKPVKAERALANKASRVASTVSAERRSYVRFLQDQFQLTDGEIKKLTFGRDLQRMGESEFSGFIRKMETRAVQMANTKQAKWELAALLEDKHFVKVENYRKVQKLPTIPNMNEAQLRAYAKSLEGFNVGDEFLSPRTLETISRTELGKVSTMRQVRTHLWEELKKNPEFKDVKLTDLENMTSNVLDNMRYDTALAEKNPFYNLVVNRTQTEMMRGKASFLKIQEETNRLTKLSNSSRKKGVLGSLKQALVPKQTEIVRYLEAEPAAKKAAMEALTKEELDLAVHMEQYYRGALDHLIAIEELRGSRYADAYFTHTKKQFLEKWSDDGLIGAVRGVFQAQKDAAQVAKIIDQDTGQILSKSKFFKYTLRRTGEGEASNNATKVFLDYVQQMERKKMLDRIIPEIEVYTQALSPKGLTKKGLELDRSLKTFINKYLNNKKGRRENFGGLLEQGGKLDVVLRLGNTFVSLKDLAGNVFAGTATFVGEFVMTYQALGKRGIATAVKRRLWDTGVKRVINPNASKILKEAEPFLGRNVWTEIMEPNVALTDKALTGIFSPFSQSSVETNKLFLLGKLTKEEVLAGKLSPQKLAELRLEAGRWRDMGAEVKSIYGATSGGATVNKYKGWAIPIARTNISNLTKLLNRIQSGNFKGTLTSREFQETYRAIEMTAAIYYVGSKAMEDVDEDTFLGKLYARIQMEALTIMGGIDPTMFVSVPRLASFIIELTKNLKTLVLLEQYKTSGKGYEEGDLKGINALQRQFTPAAVKQFTGVEQKTPEQKLKAKKAEENKAEREAVQPIYNKVQELAKAGKEDEALKIIDEMSDEDYEVYKRIRSSARAKNTESFRLKLELDPKQAVEYLRSLDKAEAERIINLMSDEEYKLYESGK